MRYICRSIGALIVGAFALGIDATPSAAAWLGYDATPAVPAAASAASGSATATVELESESTETTSAGLPETGGDMTLPVILGTLAAGTGVALLIARRRADVHGSS